MAKHTPVKPSVESEATLCDPCQVRDRGAAEICGWQGKSLAPHLKCHVLPRGQKWTTALYKKRFPKFSIGVPTYSPSPEHVAKLQASHAVATKTPEQIEIIETQKNEYDEKVNARMEELWSMCERDPAARMICLAAAKDESMLEEAYNKAEKLRNVSKPDPETLSFLNKTIASISERLQASMKSLSLTVTQRRASNQLGSDSVSQLICGYANTVRKMSPERQEAFHRRVATVMSVIAERIRVKLLDEVDTSFDQAAAGVVDESDFRAAILRFNPEKS